MTALTAALTVALASAPVDRDTGRDWVERELSRDEYSGADLTPLEQLGRWLDDVVSGLLSAALGGNSPWLLLIVAAAIAGIVVLVVWRVRRLGLRRAQVPPAAFDAVVSIPHPDPWRQSARDAAARGDHRAAVIDQSRAVFAVLAQAELIDLGAAATATEIARSAGAAVPTHRTDIDRVAGVFNDLVFGEDSAPPRSAAELGAVYEDVVALDRELSRLAVRRPTAVSR